MVVVVHQTCRLIEWNSSSWLKVCLISCSTIRTLSLLKQVDVTTGNTHVNVEFVMNGIEVAAMVTKIVVLFRFLSNLAGAAAAAVSSQHVSQRPDRSTKSKVFVTDGRDVPLIGVCVFFTRANTSKTITSENIHRVSHLVTV